MQKLFQVIFRCTEPNYYISHLDIFASMQGRYPEECNFKIEFTFDRRALEWTGNCRCPQRRTKPLCRSCQYGNSYLTEWEIDFLITDVQQRVKKNFEENLVDIKKFYLACKDFTKFLSSSILLINLQKRYLLCQTKMHTLSFDLESIFEKYMRKYERNSLSQSGKRCGLRDDASESGIYPHVRMLISSGNIFPDFADISIHGKLLALSMSMKMIYKIFSLCHLPDESINRIFLMRQFGQCIFGMFFRQQMRKCK
jgi:hypothetical protein